ILSFDCVDNPVAPGRAPIALCRADAALCSPVVTKLLALIIDERGRHAALKRERGFRWRGQPVMWQSSSAGAANRSGGSALRCRRACADAFKPFDERYRFPDRATLGEVRVEFRGNRSAGC